MILVVNVWTRGHQMTTCQVFIKIWIVSSVEFVDWKFPDGMRPYKSWIKCWLIYHWLIICHLRFTKIAGIRKIHFIQVLTCSDNFHHFRDICEASWKNTLSNRLEFHCSLFFNSNIYVNMIQCWLVHIFVKILFDDCY